MLYNPDWITKKLVCFNCGETRSVKYLTDDLKPCCNKCILKVIGNNK
jgi:hypothetical protein